MSVGLGERTRLGCGGWRLANCTYPHTPTKDSVIRQAQAQKAARTSTTESYAKMALDKNFVVKFDIPPDLT